MFAHCLPKSINPKNNEEGWFGSRGGDGNFDRRGEQERAGASGSQVSGKSRTWQRVMMMGLARSLGGKGREGGRRNLVCVIVRERRANAVNAQGVSDVLTLIPHGS